jgi:hypothetical protein
MKSQKIVILSAVENNGDGSGLSIINTIAKTAKTAKTAKKK